MISLKIESWIWYTFAIIIAVCRLVSRSLLFHSPLHLKLDDWIMCFGICTYTALVVIMNIVADKSSNLIPPGEDVHSFTKQDIDDRILGSKLVLVVEQMQCFTIWALKITLLIMYYRVTLQLRQNLYVKILAVYVGVNFAVMEVFYFALWCRPFHNYWAVPTPNTQCDAATDHLITNAVFNLSSDIIMLLIGFSLAFRSKLPWKRKIIVHAIFALGIFVIVAAVLNKYYSFSNPYGSQWTFWYIREASTAMIVANLPYTWHLLRRVFKVGAFDEEADGSVKYHSSRSARGRRTQSDGKPQTLHGQSISGSDQTSSDLDSQALKEGTVDTTCRSGRSSPAVEKHIAPLKPAAKRTWRDRGLYGREDVEAWGSDIEEEEDLEMIDRRRRLSLAITTIPTEGHTGHEDLDLHDVGGLGDMQSPPSPVHSKSSRHRHTQSDSSGQHSPTATRPKSASGAPEIAGRSNSKKSSSGKEQPRPMYASGRSKAKMPSQAEK